MMTDEGGTGLPEAPQGRGASARLTELGAIRGFATAGRAVFTLVSRRTGDRRTFRVRANRDEPHHAPQGDLLRRPTMWFIDLLTGPDNTADYTYLGFWRMMNDGALVYSHNKKGFGAAAGNIARWLTGALNSVHGEGETAGARALQFFEQCEFWHEGRCGRCGRARSRTRRASRPASGRSAHSRTEETTWHRS